MLQCWLQKQAYRHRTSPDLSHSWKLPSFFSLVFFSMNSTCGKFEQGGARVNKSIVGAAKSRSKARGREEGGTIG